MSWREVHWQKLVVINILLDMKQLNTEEFSDEGLAMVIAIHDHAGLFALAYRSGLLYFQYCISLEILIR